ncbi:MAG: class I SAM-dependent methyltransferase [Gimesia sp.]|nr:class I SAM-dependent methyltransferase [Gimesia sp.]
MTNPMYSEHARDYAAAIRDNNYNANYERPSLSALLPDVQGKAVIDLGCGPGEYSETLLKRGARVTAVDRSEQMVEIVKEKLGERIDCYQQDLGAGLPREREHSFDLAVSALMIHYLEDLSCLFQEIKRILKPGGLFVFSTHHPFVDYQLSPSGNYFLQEKIVDEWETLGRPVRVEYYRRSLSQIVQPLTEAGFCVLELTEGKPEASMAQTAPESFAKLSTEPGFLFLKCGVV